MHTNYTINQPTTKSLSLYLFSTEKEEEEEEMAIPVIDFSKLTGEERAQTLSEIAIACEDWGFFQVPTISISIYINFSLSS